MDTIFMNFKNSGTSDAHRLLINLKGKNMFMFMLLIMLN